MSTPEFEQYCNRRRFLPKIGIMHKLQPSWALTCCLVEGTHLAGTCVNRECVPRKSSGRPVALPAAQHTQRSKAVSKRTTYSFDFKNWSQSVMQYPQPNPCFV